MERVSTIARRGAARAACLVAALLLLPAMARAQQVGHTARGEAVIRGGNEIAAREEAIQAALRTAIEEAVGTQIDSATFIGEKRVIADKVLTKATGYVRRYNVRGEGKSEDGRVYWVTVHAIVDDAALDRDLAALNVVQHLRERPRVALLVRATDVRALTATANVEAAYLAGGDYRALAEAAVEQSASGVLLDANFRVVDKLLVDDAYGRDTTLVGDILNDPAAAQRLGTRLEADYLITVTVTPEPTARFPGNPRLQMAHVSTQARVVARDSGRVVVAVQGEGTQGHVSPAGAVTRAATKAGEQLGGRLKQKIGALWAGEVSNTSEITLVLTNLSSRRHFILVREFLRGLEQTRGTHEDDYTAGTASIRIEYAGKATTLADKLALQEFDGFRLEPQSVDQNKILLEVQE